MADEPGPDSPSEREKWGVEVRLRERELDIKALEQKIQAAEVEARIKEQARSRWSSPLVLVH
jgi:hypothetical protein